MVAKERIILYKKLMDISLILSLINNFSKIVLLVTYFIKYVILIEIL
jgi:hypothetical protein